MAAPAPPWPDAWQSLPRDVGCEAARQNTCRVFQELGFQEEPQAEKKERKQRPKAEAADPSDLRCSQRERPKVRQLPTMITPPHPSHKLFNWRWSTLAVNVCLHHRLPGHADQLQGGSLLRGPCQGDQASQGAAKAR